MTKKSIDDYAADILQLTVDISLIPPYHPAVEKLTRQLSNRLGAWQGLLEITIFVAQNENHPWELEGMNVNPMPLKSESKHIQTGDYIYAITDGAQIQSWGNLVVERKGGGASDLYGTLMNRDSRERFYREVARFEADPRFSQMIIIAECTLHDFLTYAPKFNGKNYNKHHTGASTESRRATIAGLFARGVPVFFAGSRQEAQKVYLQLVRQSIIKSYKLILGIEV